MALRDERGTLYEIPILFVVFMIALAIAVPEAHQHGALRGLLAGLLVVGVIIGAFFALIFAVVGFGKLLETRPARAIAAIPWLPKAGRLLGWTVLALLVGFGCASFSTLVVSAFTSSGRALIAWAAASGLAGFALVAFGAWLSA